MTRQPSPLVKHGFEEVYEELAATQHDIWAHWMRYQFEEICEEQEGGSLVIPGEWVRYWTRQMNTPYEDLTPGERHSDRDQVDKILAALARLVLGDH